MKILQLNPFLLIEYDYDFDSAVLEVNHHVLSNKKSIKIDNKK
jgi:hypothetical protein